MMASQPTTATDEVMAAADPADFEAGVAAIEREWIDWSQRTGVHEPTFTEALRFFGYLMVERADVLERSGDETAQWGMVLGYLDTRRP
jgi:hypothetical protein